VSFEYGETISPKGGITFQAADKGQSDAVL
jgi:hypothetical protein